MSDIILYDSFSGTGLIDGRTPDYCYTPSEKWYSSSSSPDPRCDNGFLIGDTAVYYGNFDAAIGVIAPPTTHFYATFKYVSGAEVEANPLAGFLIGFQTSGSGVEFSLRREASTGVDDWVLRTEELGFGGAKVTTVIPPGVITPNTPYFVTVESNALGSRVSMAGYSAGVATPAGNDSIIIVVLEIGRSSKIGPLSVYDGILDGTVEFTFPMMELGFTMLVEPVFPMMQLEANFGASVDFNFPMPSSEYVFASAIDFTFPMMTLDAGFVKNASFDFDFPMMRLDASFGGGSDWTFPAMTLDAKLTNTEGKNALDFAFPMMAFDGQMGGQIGFDFPIMTLEADMTQTALIQVDFTFPVMTVDAALSGEPYKASVDFEFPMAQFEAQFGFEAAFNLPMMTIDANLQAGGVLSLDFKLPMMTLDANLTQENHCWVEFTFPMMVPVHGITCDFAIPMMQLDAHIRADVAVTYEAYSVNLTHTAETPTDEVTRYTNYPFDHIVRLGTNYYGVATDGLYLLGGKLDNAQPIAYTVKTCIDDFKVKEFKNIASGYFGGRIGPDMKVTVYAGEQGDESYDYSTPRGQGAQNHREKFGRGVKNRYYAIGVSGEEELVLDNIELEINKMTRRI